MQLLIVRHGHPEPSPPGSGPADPGLTELGRRQARAVAQWLVHDPGRAPGRLLSSPMQRARQTAEAIGVAAGLAVEIDDRLAEFDQGARQYVPMELAGRGVVEQAMAALETGRWGEHRFDPEEFRTRVRAAFDEIAGTSDAARVVVVCHGGVINSYLSGVLGRPHAMFFRPRYTSVSQVGIDRAGRPNIVSLNEFPQWATVPPRPPGRPRIVTDAARPDAVAFPVR